ncbi:MAG: bifunctional homocysteine S-methyltransferase/methylenetetrahydrofolate reductase [Candidatus Krumholzibacteriales bacterium]
MKRDFREMLTEGVVLFDGAMGTMLYQRGIFINRCFDEVNLARPDMVREIHLEYISAGADVIETNTFGANFYKLKQFGIEDRMEEINIKGASIATEAAGGSALVAGAIGPLGIKIEPWGPTSNSEAMEAFKLQAAALLEGGVDLFILETFADLNEIHQALKAVREISGLPVISQMTVQQDGIGLYGTEPGVFAGRLDEWGSDAVGVNCNVGPKVMLEVIEKMAPCTSKPVSAQPNAGIPQNVDDRNIYMVSPEYIAEYARRFVKKGVRIIGGCCGTTPGHIEAIRKSVRDSAPAMKIRLKKAECPEPRTAAESVPTEAKSSLASKVYSKDPAKLVELVPPRGCDPGKVLESAAELAGAGVDAINIPDSPRATSRMSALSLALIIQGEIGTETLLHYCCRDRNILGMQSDLLGAEALGLKNILIITGDPLKTHDYPDATAVFDIDSIGLTNVVNNLNQGLDIGGRKLDRPTSLFIGVGVNPQAINLEDELNRFYWKVDAGAEFAMTQPVFDPDSFFSFKKKIESMDIPVIAGIWPLASYRNAEFMNNELPGVSVPESIMERMKNAPDGRAAAAEGVKIAVEILDEIKSEIAGVQVSAPFNRSQLAMDVLSTV